MWGSLILLQGIQSAYSKPCQQRKVFWVFSLNSKNTAVWFIFIDSVPLEFIGHVYNATLFSKQSNIKSEGRKDGARELDINFKKH